jgi:outer membrane lipoprotein-sorting protein
MLNNRINRFWSWMSLCSVALIGACSVLPRTMAQVPGGPADGPPAASPVQPASAPPASGAPEKVEELPTRAELDIDAAVKKIAGLNSVSAELVEEVNMLNQKFTIKGTYRKGPNNLVYLRLAVAGLPDSVATSLQVCDGETLWDYQLVLENPLYRKLSVKPILERLNSPEMNPKTREQALVSIGVSGPETLLLGLRRTIKFEVKEEGELDGMKVWLFRGTWRSRQGLVSPDGRPVAPGGFLPPYIPMDATLYLGKDDSWPYKLVLVGRKPSVLYETRRIGPDGRPIGAKGSIEKITPSEITLVYKDVKLNPKLRLEEFAFMPPPTANVDDGTEGLVKLLDSAIQAEVQRKKNDSAKKEGPVLDQSLDLPAPPDPTAAPRP